MTTDPMERDRVLVVGGGIAGLAVAAALRPLAVPVTVFERHQSTGTAAGLGLNLPGNAIAALQALGLGDAVDRLGAPVRCREYRNQRGRLLFAVDETAFWGVAAQPRCVVRAELHTALLGMIGPGVVRNGAAVADVTTTAGGARLTLTDGATATGGLVIGADGVRSVVRDRLSGGHSVRAALLSQASWRFVTANPGVDCWTAWTGGPGTILVIPLARDRLYGWLSPTSDAQSFSQAADRFAGFPATVAEVLATAAAEAVPPFGSPLEEVRPAAWTTGRGILIGDAAHATAPVWAQGAALAVEDALAVADVLADPKRWPCAGEEFAQRRRPRVEHVQAMTDRFSRVARLPPSLRNLVTPLVGPRTYRATYGPLREPVQDRMP
jgi:2-polyprenyl-6-methoxyphenol hydroxylase-like FAD-dependent oxidoreductase